MSVDDEGCVVGAFFIAVGITLISLGFFTGHAIGAEDAEEARDNGQIEGFAKACNLHCGEFAAESNFYIPSCTCLMPTTVSRRHSAEEALRLQENCEVQCGQKIAVSNVDVPICACYDRIPK